jgi:hypothetical protein
MRPKKPNGSIPAQAQVKVDSGNDHSRNRLRLIGLRLAAIFLVIVFIAGECAVLLPAQ